MTRPHIGVQRLIFCLAFLFLGLLKSATAGSIDPYLQQLIARAEALRLWERPEWIGLVHYRPRWNVGALRSMADSPEFFNAPDGVSNPRAELLATLTSFFSDQQETPDQQNPQCRFIARFAWLNGQLAFDSQRMPRRMCNRFEAWRDYMDPTGVALVFPAAYLNNPASMFGHTFLRIDGKGQTGQSRLLAHSINFLASTQESSGIIFSIKGLFGGYSGKFNHGPYFEKVSEYTDLESRDMWEYQLLFTQDETERLLMHAWELGPVRFDYYYLDENCSYNLLALMEVARPSLKLTDQFPGLVIPGDTVRAVARAPGLVGGTSYRPSRASQLVYRQSVMEPRLVAAAQEFAKPTGPDSVALGNLPVQERAAVLDLAFEYLEYLRLRGNLSNQEAGPRLRRLLAWRSALNVPDLPEAPTPSQRPEDGHASSRLSLAMGQHAGQAFTELLWRPAYHELMDPEAGFINGAQIEFLSLRLRQTPQTPDPQLEQLGLVNVVSLSLQDALLKPASWRIDVGARRVDANDGSRPLVWMAEGGRGGATRWGPSGLLSAMVEGSVLSGCALEDCYSAGGGVGLGAVADVLPGWRAAFRLQALRYTVGDVRPAFTVEFKQRLTLGRDTAMHLNLIRQQLVGQPSTEVQLRMDWHF